MVLNIFNLLIVCTVLFFASNATCSAAEKQSNKQYSVDEQIIRAQAIEYTKNFAVGDVQAIAAVWIVDGTFTDTDGSEFSGRAEIEKLYTRYFKEHGKQALEININSIRFPASNMAIEEGTTKLSGDTPAVIGSKYVVVHVKQNGKWQICNATEISLKPIISSESLNDLSWIVGKWAPEIAKDKVQLKANWISDRHFINCTFVLKELQTDKVSDVQVIGWDSIRQQPTSWNFSSSGGFGRAFWTKSGPDWWLHAHSVQSDGIAGQATYVLHKLDNDTFTWKSVRRSFGGRSLPDTPEIKLVRIDNTEGF